jgi:hypothetical protein
MGDKKYVKYLLEEAEKLLEDKKFKEIFEETFSCYNNGHSGWTTGVVDLYFSPSGDEEKMLSEELEYLLLRTAIGLIETVKPTGNILEYMDVEAIAICLGRIGKKAPKALIRKTLHLIDQCKDLGIESGFLEISTEQVLYKYCEYIPA